jgi:small subunit ribosomal protein S10
MKVTYNIKLKAFDSELLTKSVNNIFLKLKACNHLLVKGPINLPTKYKRFTILRSPHINKLSREQFEIRTHKKLLVVTSNLNCEKTRLLVKNYKKAVLPTGLILKIERNIYMPRTTRTSNL